MKRIPLTQNKFALVDDCDYEYLLNWKWYYSEQRNSPKHLTGYARTCLPGSRSCRSSIYMHRIIAARKGLHITGRRVDHKDQNGINNRRHNLRLATRSQNGANRKLNLNSTSGLKGVHWHQRDQVWVARISVEGVRLQLGSFPSPIKAAKAYNKAAKKYFGKFAYLNKV